MKKETVVVFGYSDSVDRYSNMAFHLLEDYHHIPIKYNPRVDKAEDLPKNYDTATLYMSAAISEKFEQVILAGDFKRIIINPGAENQILEEKLIKKGVEVIHGCTLVMLRTNQF